MGNVIQTNAPYVIAPRQIDQTPDSPARLTQPVRAIRPVDRNPSSPVWVEFADDAADFAPVAANDERKGSGQKSGGGFGGLASGLLSAISGFWTRMIAPEIDATGTKAVISAYGQTAQLVPEAPDNSSEILLKPYLPQMGNGRLLDLSI